MTENTPSRASGLVTVQLGSALKLEWVKWCQERDLVPGKALRTLVEKALAEGLELSASGRGARVVVKVGREPDIGQKVGREVYFTPSENAAVLAVSAAQGFGFHEWVIAAVRVSLSGAASYGQADLEALTKSNLVMAQLVIELAALRRQAPEGLVGVELEELEKSVKKHVETVSAAMAQGTQRWQLKV